ncbi:MAG: serine hydrolase [Gammaproteobacteria bacterium]|nr:serine hydrolase [Gammaproteobacteria bacterium]
MKRYHVHGAAMVILSHGKTRTYVFGEAVPAKHIPVTKDTIFELGSVTKTFTGMILAKHIIGGQTQLSEPIQSYLDTPHSKSIGKVTYLQLATHVSGLPFNARRLPYNASASFANRLKYYYYLKSSSLAFSPSSQMLYSNFAYGVLGRLLAKKERTSLPELMKRDILSPLNMHTSGLDIGRENQKYLAQGFTAQGNPVPYLPSGLLGGAWAMRASVKDMAYYLKAAVGEPSIPAPIHRAMRLAQIPYYDLSSEGMQFGLGWVITPFNQANAVQRLIRRPEHYHFVPYRVKKIAHPHFNPDALIGKTGATDGFRAYIAVLPKNHTGIVVMVNQFSHSNGRLTRLANEILLRER